LRVLLTGATGLIGSAVLAALRSEGHEVVAIVSSAASASRLPSATRCIALDIGRAERIQPAQRYHGPVGRQVLAGA